MTPSRIHTTNLRIIIAAMLFAAFVLGTAVGMAITMYLTTKK